MLIFEQPALRLTEMSNCKNKYMFITFTQLAGKSFHNLYEALENEHARALGKFLISQFCPKFEIF